MGPSHALAVSCPGPIVNIRDIRSCKVYEDAVDQRPTMRRKCCWRTRPWLSRSCKRNEVGDDPRRPHRRRAYAQGANSSSNHQMGGAAAQGPPLREEHLKYAATNDAHKPNDERSALQGISITTTPSAKYDATTTSDDHATQGRATSRPFAWSNTASSTATSAATSTPT